ncbi:UPF0175 family protein [Natronoarchaeum sp. GCM10025703]|uniref:UPF0175 family protein n=1 Tax=unclassified Natronoarchaeum TaxID=2620183 RepID=UPI003605D7EB
MSDLTDDVETIASVGGYEDADDVLEDALGELLRRRPNLRLSLAIEKYRHGSVSLNRAAELADVSTEAFKDELASRGIHRTAGFLDDEDRDATLRSL